MAVFEMDQPTASGHRILRHRGTASTSDVKQDNVWVKTSTYGKERDGLPPMLVGADGKPRYRGRNSDPESPPSGASEADGRSSRSDEVPQCERGRLKALGPCVVIALGLFILSVYFRFSQAPEAPLQPHTKLRMHKIGGGESFADIKVCQRPPCNADCHTMDTSSRRSVISGVYPVLAHNLEGAVHLSCTQAYYITMRVCNNPGEQVYGSRPHYFLGPDNQNPHDVCKDVYPGRPLLKNLMYPNGTVLHLTVCVDGWAEPVKHEIHCL